MSKKFLVGLLVGPIAATMLVSQVARAELVSSVDIVMFGDVSIGASVTQTVTLTNIGTRVVENIVTGISGNGEEYIITKGCSIQLFPGQLCNMDIRLTPQHYGAKRRKLNIDAIEMLEDGSVIDHSLSIPLVGTSDNPNKP